MLICGDGEKILVSYCCEEERKIKEEEEKKEQDWHRRCHVSSITEVLVLKPDIMKNMEFNLRTKLAVKERLRKEEEKNRREAERLGMPGNTWDELLYIQDS